MRITQFTQQRNNIAHFEDLLKNAKYLLTPMRLTHYDRDMTNPAERIIKLCGGADRVAEFAEISKNRVLRWTYPKARGGTDGLIPTSRQQLIMQNAVAAGIKIKPADFFVRA